MADEGRIWEHPVLDFKKGEKICFSYNGKKIDALEGETIAAALYAAGVKIFSRSFKYHRPRGMFCGIGKCSNCLMRVNGVPNVRTCITPVKKGMMVESQNSFPSADHDLFSIVGNLPFDIHPGFYYEKFIRPGFMKNTYHTFFRHFSGIGRFPEKPIIKKERIGIKERDTDLAIIGAGPAGLSAAVYAGQYGVKVMLIDENQRLGGQLVKQTHRFFGSSEHGAGKRGTKIAEDMVAEIKNLKNVETLLEATVIGIYEGKVLGVMKRDEFIRLNAKRIIVATGAYEKTLIFKNNDLPGVYGAGGAQTLMNVYGVSPGATTLMIGAGNVGLIVSYQLIQAGTRVQAVVEALPNIGGYMVHAAKLRRLGVPILTSHTVKKALGKKRVEGARIVQLDEQWNEVEGTERDMPCDFICVSVGLKPTFELLHQAGCNLQYISELGGHAPLHNQYMETTVKGIYVAGDVSGIEEASTAIMEGRVAGISAVLSLKEGDEKAKRIREEALDQLQGMRSSPFGERVRNGLEKILIKEVV